MSRLAELLHRFKLPSSASQAELRRAYYKRAKLLHPDIAGEASESDFKRLRQDYDEAKRLLDEGKSGKGQGSHKESHEQSWTAPGGQQWTASAFAGNFHGNFGFREGKVNFDPRGFRQRNRSHAEDFSTGYSYKASGRAAPKAQAVRTFNPAQIFKKTLFLTTVLGFFFRNQRFQVSPKAYVDET